MEKIAVGLGGILAIFFVAWFFFGKKEKTTKASSIKGVQKVEIVVDGGYLPDVVEVKKAVPVRLEFFRKDPSSCLEEVVLSDFKIRKKLALNKKTVVEFIPEKSGDFDFACGMGMFHGKIIVR